MLHNLRHEPPSHKPRPKPSRLGKRKRVTIIAAFQCSDGLLMCADSEQTISVESKSQTRKIFASRYDFGSVAIGGAGDASLIEYVQQRLHRDLTFNPPTLATFESSLVTYADDVFDKQIRPYATFPSNYIPEFELLIGLQMNGEYRLYRWERNFVYHVPSGHTSIGIGTLQSESLMGNQQLLWLPANQMLFSALRMMLRVKQLVQGCGGKTEVLCLSNDGSLISLPTRYIDAIEHLVDEVDMALFLGPLAFVAGHRWNDEGEEVELKAEADSLKRFKAKYEKLISQWGVAFPPPLEY